MIHRLGPLSSIVTSGLGKPVTHGAVCRSLIRTIAPESLSVAILGGNKAIPTIQFSIGDGYTFLLTVPVFGSPSVCSTSLRVNTVHLTSLTRELKLIRRVRP